MHNAQAMIHGLGSGFGFLVELMPDIIQQGGLADFRQRLWQRPFAPPTGEVQQVISVSAQRAQRQLANTLTIEEGIGPGDLLAMLVEQAIGRNAGQNGRSMDQKGFHSGRACSRQWVKSAAVAPARK